MIGGGTDLAGLALGTVDPQTAAWDVIRAQGRQVLGLSARIGAAQRQAQDIIQAARARNLKDVAAEANRQYRGLVQLREKWVRAGARLDQIKSYLPGAGLGLVPVAVVAVLGVAGVVSLAALLREISSDLVGRERTMRQLQEAVVAGRITPEQARAIAQATAPAHAGGPFAALGEGVGKVAALVALVVAVPLLTPLFKGNR